MQHIMPKQEAIEVKAKMKDETVCRLLDVVEPKKAIIFCNTKKKVDSLIDELKSKSYRAEALHGDIKQNQRDGIMKKLKSGDERAIDLITRPQHKFNKAVMVSGGICNEGLGK